jgi:hypothetical protein
MEIISSFAKNIKDKLANPFFGTLILFLIIHHWELWYTVFNFDSTYILEDKVRFIKSYAKYYLNWRTITRDIVYSSFLMTIGYGAIVVTRSLVLWVELRLMPILTGIIINKNVVLKSKYDTLSQERDKYFDKYNEQRSNVMDYSRIMDEQMEQIRVQNSELLKQSREITDFAKQINEGNKKLESLRLNYETMKLEKDKGIKLLSAEKIIADIDKKRLQQFSDLFFDGENKLFYSSIDKFPPQIIKIVTELKKDSQWESFLSAVAYLDESKGNTLSDLQIKKMLQKEMLFEGDSNRKPYVSPLGKIIYHYRIVFQPNKFYN